MKKFFSRFMAVMLIMFSVSFAASAQLVKIKPIHVVKVRPAAPGPKHVWVSEEYAWKGKQYAYTEGYWVVPTGPRTAWVEGRWRHKRGGWVWVPGHWR